jgi:5-hydroxyisourate hydrolase-like protein (transthyretin family)
MPDPKIKNAFIRFLMFLIIGGLAASFFANAAWAQATGSISGRVTRDSDATGISGVAINIYSSGWGSVKSGTTDASGNYTISALAAGNYYVGTGNSLGYLNEYYDNVTSQALATAVSVASGATTSNINFGLGLGGIISGQVTRDSDGTGISGVTVNIYNASWGSVKSGTTDSAGNYSISGLASGSYYLRASGTGYINEFYDNVTSQGSATAVSVASDATTANINFGLAAGGTIAGRVTRDSDGAGISGVSINIYNTSWSSIKSGTTDSTGNYSISGLAADSYYVGTSSAAYVNEFYDNVTSQGAATQVSVASDATTANINFGLAGGGAGGGTIAGRVTRDSDGAGLAGIYVTIYNTSGSAIKIGMTTTGGNYSITGLAASSYYVGANTSISSSTYIGEYYNNVTSLSAATALSVALDATTSNINFGLGTAGTISGRVTRDSDGTGLSGVTVTIYNKSAAWFFSVKSGTTDSAGNYSIPGLAAGSYYVGTANSLGYANEYYNNVTSQNAAAEVSVALGATTSNINFGLALGGAISGRVTRDSDGAGISGVTVTIYDAGWAIIKSGTTDAAGYYLISSLAPGIYYVGASSTVYANEYYNNVTSQSAATAVSVVSNATTSNVNFGLAVGGTIAGRVTRDSDGTGISGVYIYAYSDSWGLIRSGTTDAAGNYSISGLAGSYYVGTGNSLGYVNEYYDNVTSQSAATAVSVALGDTTANINFGLAAGGTIAGRVTRDSDGTGLSGVYIYAYNDSWSLIRSGTTDSAGNYTISGLAAGSYYVGTGNSSGYTDEYYNNVTSQSLAATVSVTSNTTTSNINFGLAGGGTISGQVARDSDGTGLSGVTVSIYNTEWSQIKSGMTDAAGNYSISGLAAGRYYVGTANSLGYVDEYFYGETSRSWAIPLNVSSGATTSDIYFSLSLGGTISGRVTRDSDGTGISGILINIYNASWSSVKSGTTDSAGNYSISGLAAGTYYVGTYNSPGYVDEYYNNVTTQSSATAVIVVSGAATANINFGLGGGGTIAGRVTRDSDGTGISGVAVGIYNTGWSQIKSGTTDSAGNYSISGLAAGSYHVRTNTSTTYINEYYNNVTSPSSAAAVNVELGATTSNIDFGLAVGGTIAGRVTRDSDGTGIYGIGINVYNTSGSSIKSGSTDSAGNYSISGLAAGNYYVGTSGTVYANEYYNNVTSQRSATAVGVALGSTTSNINFSLGLLGTITGRVTRDSDGTGISGIAVMIYNTGWSQINNVTTDSAGNYSIPSLNAGGYYLQTGNYNPTYQGEYYNNVTSQRAATAVSVALDATTSNINFSLATLGTITGRVTRDSDGTGLSGVYIYIYDSNWRSVYVSGYAATDATGNYSISGLAPGSYYLQTSAYGYINEYYNNVTSQSLATAVSVALGATTANINFGLAAGVGEAGGTITGRVTRDTDGAGISGTWVYLYDTTKPNWSMGVGTDASGNYRLTGLAAGSYYLKASGNSIYADQYYNNAASLASATPVAVTAGATTAGINFSLPLGGTISGRVVRDTDGAGISGVYLNLHDSTTQYYSSRYAYTDAEGNYSVSGLSTGNYYLEASGSPPYIGEYYNNAASLSSATPIAATVGVSTTGINFSLSLGGTISGRVVRDTDGAAIEGATVEVFMSFSDMSGQTTLTNAQGYYALSGLTPGNYFVLVRSENYVQEYYGNTIHNWAAQAVSVASGVNPENINFGLAAGGSVSGRVTRDSDGTGIPAISVYAYSPDHDHDWDWDDDHEDYTIFATTDSEGYYRLSGMPAGKYVVLASWQNYDDVSKYYNNAKSEATATKVTVADDSDTPDINFGLSSGNISGTITCSDCESSGSSIQLKIYDTDWNVIQSTSAWIYAGSGTYSTDGLLPGEYYVGVKAPGYSDHYYNNALSRSGAIAVTVGQDATTENIDFDLGSGQATGSISGRVTSAFNASVLSDISIEVFDSNWNYVASGTTDWDSGEYIIEGLPAGDYYLRTNRAYGFVNKYYDDAASASGAIAVTVTENTDTPHIDFALDAGLTIYGRVFDNSNQKFIQGVQVNAYDLNWALAGTGVSDYQGNFSIDGLAPGEYSLRTHNNLGYIDEFNHNASSWNKAAKVNLTVTDRFVSFGLDKATTTLIDFNGDGKPDILWRNSSTGEVYVWFMDGETRIGEGSLSSVPDRDQRIAALADFNRDGKIDILWRNAVTGENTIWYMDGVTLMQEAALPLVDDLQWKIAGAVDFDNNGEIDILWRNLGTGDNYLWYMDGTEVTGAALLPPVSDLNWNIAGVADFNDDGKLDILWRNVSTGENYVWYMNGTEVTGAATLPPVADLDWKISFVADFNNDGMPDVLWRNITTGENYLWYMDGVTVGGAASLETVTGANWLPFDVGEAAPQCIGADFNNDGKPDILWRNETTGENYIWYMDDTAVTGSGVLPTVNDQDWKITGVADFDNDGKQDILWRNAVSGENYLWYLDGAAVTGGGTLPTVADENWKIAGVADFDNDGKQDILWRNAASGENYLWYMDGAAVTGGGTLPTVAELNWKIAGVADFNNDGNIDLLWRNVASGENYVWYINGASVTGSGSLPAVVDQNWEIVGIADFNGDGNPDIIWRNLSTGEDLIWHLDGITCIGGDSLPTVPDQSWTIAPQDY